MKFSLSVYLPVPIQGVKLIEGFERVTQELGDQLVKDAGWVADSEAFALEAGPAHYGYSAKLFVGRQFSSESVEPSRRYVSFSLANSDGTSGIVYAVNIEDSTIVEYVQQFRLRLISAVAEILNVSVDVILENSKRLAGSGANDIVLACDYCGAGFKEKPEVCPHCGAPTGQIIQVY